jgi:restriction endonuclease S subunit
LDGLEAVELELSETIKENIFRLDSEHYQHKYLVLKNLIDKHYSVNLSELVTQTISTGHTPSMKNDNFYGGNIKFIKTNNLRDNYIKPEFDHYLSEEGNEDIKRTQLKENDVIVTIIGATQEIVGRATKISKEILPANINQNIALIRLNISKINPDFINIYLNSKYGKQYLYYLSRQTEQVNLNCEEIGRVKIPIFSNIFQYK